MRKAFYFLLCAIIVLCIFVACKDNPAADDVQMTEYYAAGRKAYKLVMDIELPELEEIGLKTDDKDYASKLAYLKGIEAGDEEIEFNMDTGITAERVKAIKDVFVAKLGKPTFDGDDPDIPLMKTIRWDKGENILVKITYGSEYAYLNISYQPPF
ncbi:MAG: hypothetical protein J5891_04850 [Spirochaetales bacterium]|nr:hypothetical protein [Spirochaetales bacterium]